LLSDWGKTPRKVEQKIDPRVDTKTEPLKQANEMPPIAYFKYGAELMKVNPPHATDWSINARMTCIGLEPGKSFDDNKVSADVLARGATAGLKLMRDKMPTLARVTNGWQVNTETMGVYGNYYLKRAIVAMAGLGANQADDAIYPLNVADVDGKRVTAENSYVLHFNKDELPPVSAFWSLTMYDGEGFQVDNPINRFAIGDRDALKFNADGSLDLYIQNQNPGPGQGVELVAGAEERQARTDAAPLRAQATGGGRALESAAHQVAKLTPDREASPLEPVRLHRVVGLP
jgi:hypothetical protein